MEPPCPGFQALSHPFLLAVAGTAFSAARERELYRGSTAQILMKHSRVGGWVDGGEKPALTQRHRPLCLWIGVRMPGGAGPSRAAVFRAAHRKPGVPIAAGSAAGTRRVCLYAFQGVTPKQRHWETRWILNQLRESPSSLGRRGQTAHGDPGATGSGAVAPHAAHFLFNARRLPPPSAPRACVAARPGSSLSLSFPRDRGTAVGGGRAPCPPSSAELRARPRARRACEPPEVLPAATQ